MERLTALPARFCSEARTQPGISGKQNNYPDNSIDESSPYSGCHGSKRSEPSVKQVSNYLSSLTKYNVFDDGSIKTISANKSRTLYVLEQRADLKKAEAAQCRANRQAMHHSSASLIYPAGDGQNFFPFAKIDIKQGNPHKISCDQLNGVKLIALLDPHVRSLPKQAA